MDENTVMPATSAAPPGELAVPRRPSRRRRRPALSCSECRRRKVKCDQREPCTQCVKSKNAICKYDPDATPKAREVNSNTTTSRLPTSKLLPRQQADISASRSSKSLINSVTAPVYPNPGYPTTNSFLEAASGINHSPSEQNFEITATQEPPQNEQSVQELKDRVRQLETMVSCMINPEQSSPVQDSDGPTNVFPKLKGSTRKARFFTRAHWMNTKGEFDQIQAWRKTRRDNQSSELNQALKKCKNLARTIKAKRPTQSSPLPDFKSEVPDRETADLLVQVYFRSFESIYRVLHRHSFLKEYEQFWADPTTASTTFTIKLLLVLSIGAIFTSDDVNTIRSLGLQWINTTQTYLNNPFEKSRLNLASVEIQILLILARQTHSIGGDLLWISVGSLIRTGMSIGLHRDPSNFPKLPPSQAEIRRRLWATIIELAIQASLDCGMPPMISFEDFDCDPPSNYNDADFSEETKTLPPAKPDSIFTETSIQRTLLKSLETRMKIFRQINDFHSPAPGYEKILSLSTELTSHLSSHSALYHSSSSSSAQSPSYPIFTTTHKNLLDLLTRRFLLTLHLPFAVLAKTDPRYYFSRKIVLDSALLLFSYPSDPLSDFEAMKLISGGPFREGFSRASSAICLELIAQINEDSSPSFASMSGVGNMARKGLHDAVEQVVDFSKRRLERGETNVKGFLFWSMVRAQTLAMEAKSENPTIDIQEEIGKGAKQAADEAYAILRKQAGYTPSSGLTPASGGDSLIGTPGEMNVDWDALMQDTTMDFDFANTWLLDSWENI